MRQVVNGRKYSAKKRCFRAVKFDPVTDILSSAEISEYDANALCSG